jgi:hypothetical protein
VEYPKWFDDGLMAAQAIWAKWNNHAGKVQGLTAGIFFSQRDATITG